MEEEEEEEEEVVEEERGHFPVPFLRCAPSPSSEKGGGGAKPLLGHGGGPKEREAAEFGFLGPSSVNLTTPTLRPSLPQSLNRSIALFLGKAIAKRPRK